MKHVLRLSPALFFSVALAAGGESTGGRSVDLKASDGTKLAATYYSASDAPGPGILLLHQCNRDRSSWNGLAADLAGKGFRVLTLDYRGYGDSGGTPYTKLTLPEQREVGKKWPGDVDVAFAYLVSQPGVRKDAIGAGGASCGVNQSIQLARRHPEVKSLVLLSGNTNRDGRLFLRSARTLPLLLSAADDDGGAVELMAWLDACSANPATRFVQFAQGGHGTEMFKAHPDLPGDIVTWYQATLEGKPSAAPANARAKKNDPRTALLVMIDDPGGPARVAESLANERKKNPDATVLAPGFVNQLGYVAIEAQDPRAAVAIMQVNVDGHPKSSNAWDSLGDALLADGQREKARDAAQKALALVDTDTAETEEQRKLIRDSAQQKLDQLTNTPAKK
jgi:dienelactone hydrolase